MCGDMCLEITKIQTSSADALYQRATGKAAMGCKDMIACYTGSIVFLLLGRLAIPEFREILLAENWFYGCCLARPAGAHHFQYKFR